MNDNDKELMIAVLCQIGKLDFRALTQRIKPDVQPEDITRAMIESTRIRWNGLKRRHGIEALEPPDTPQRAPPKRGKSNLTKRKADNDEDIAESPSPSKKNTKGKAKAKAIVKLERIDKEDKAFDNAMFGLDPNFEA